MKKSCDEGLDSLSSQCYLGFNEAQTEGTYEMTTYEIRPGTFAPCELFAVDERGERYIIAGTHTVCARVKDEIETAMKGR